MSKYFRVQQENKVLEPKAKGSYSDHKVENKVLEPEAKGSYSDHKVENKVLEPEAKGSYNREYFEQTTLGLTGNLFTNPLKRSIYLLAPFIRAMMIKLFLNPKTVLDVGCGKGSLVLWLRRLGTEAYGADISDYALEAAPEQIKKYLSKADLLNLPFENSSFELITTFDVLEHIRKEDLPRAIKECQRVVKGWVLHKIHGTTRFEQRFPVKDPTHVTIRSRKWWETLFAKLKLKPAAKLLPKWEAGIFLLAKGC